MISKSNSQFNWGQSLLYSLAADNNIHPTYIQEMISDPRYDDQRILEAISFMKNVPSASFNKEFLDNFMKIKMKRIILEIGMLQTGAKIKKF